jgi:anti-sigma regulatory factor (Ser/Thr protein kinase)
MSDGPATRSDETIQLPAEPRAVRIARQFVAVALSRRGWADLDSELAQLATSELVANAVLYAPGRLALRCIVDDELRLEVTDGHASAALDPGRPRADGIGGLGLQLVAQICRDWGVERAVGAKTVWCVLARRRHPADRDMVPAAS